MQVRTEHCERTVNLGTSLNHFHPASLYSVLNITWYPESACRSILLAWSAHLQNVTATCEWMRPLTVKKAGQGQTLGQVGLAAGNGGRGKNRQDRKGGSEELESWGAKRNPSANVTGGLVPWSQEDIPKQFLSQRDENGNRAGRRQG